MNNIKSIPLRYLRMRKMKLTENLKSWETSVSKIIAKAWMDDEFRKRLIDEPTAILREAGLVLEDLAKVIINQGTAKAGMNLNSDGTMTIDLPAKPNSLADEKMNHWSAGTGDIVGCCC